MRYEVKVPKRFDAQFVRAVAAHYNVVEVITSGNIMIYIFSNEDDAETFEQWFNEVRFAAEG